MYHVYSRSDNKVHGNRREVEKAIESCRCLFQVSGNTCYPMHDFYRCVTYMLLYCIEGYVYQRYVSDSQSARPLICLSACLSVRPSVRHSFSPPANQFICFFVSESVSLSMSQSVRHTSVRPSVSLSVCLSVLGLSIVAVVCRLWKYDPFFKPVSLFILCIHRCTTCGTSEGYAICVSCVRGCHEGHEVKFVRRDRWGDNMKIASNKLK